MDIGVGLPTTVPGADGRSLTEFARRADRNGFSTLGVIDRLVYDSYDSIVTLAAAAAVTERIRLATTVLLAAYRPSVAQLAKQLASLDRLSGGRFVLGVAAGGREDDFAATATAYHDRGRRLDAMLAELRQLWHGDGTVSGIGPSPVRGDIPLWIGGHSVAARRRAADRGLGWLSPGGSLASYPELVRDVRASFAARGRADPPRMVALSYVSLGVDGAQHAARYLRSYYSYMGRKAEYLAAGVITDESALRQTAEDYAAAGCDEVLFFPCTADPDQADLIAKAVLR
ncbi:alkanesulfonate monooxygenase SsuD/methylene tetrahydromethanopterin reductase-like flavin-dependent oxidoreductase (luciferase family) [Kibdelosporangium banguiense]|uniref:Alkanesulfonate monooxygenase SsuD/methylene tetrahydromethanopterin reductase-like flavin-dependent oxidoreductase (Luciferase family) n=1 Tax=Kibdelosporangium banguiense TaxID=1365924 RepID=A0ABS4TS71_9PSEU|nr:LLM class flavin-dependent oxidoreductase [Kibdelosporangium banguiense]MBP2327254.1 alkanesulfonate monooxygenase SsuD/methylene tetrahydromethanopterin reductase-like flavin-dependent oxidoreductase (luciferase family) [Kibdelosporangium banguiense]